MGVFGGIEFSKIVGSGGEAGLIQSEQNHWSVRKVGHKLRTARGRRNLWIPSGIHEDKWKGRSTKNWSCLSLTLSATLTVHVICRRIQHISVQGHGLRLKETEKKGDGSWRRKRQLLSPPVKSASRGSINGMLQGQERHSEWGKAFSSHVHISVQQILTQTITRKQTLESSFWVCWIEPDKAP